MAALPEGIGNTAWSGFYALMGVRFPTTLGRPGLQRLAFWHYPSQAATKVRKAKEFPAELSALG